MADLEREFPLSISGIMGSVKKIYDPELSEEANIQAITAAFENKTRMTNRETEQFIGEHISQFSLSSTARSRGERRKCHDLSVRARRLIATKFVEWKKLDEGLNVNDPDIGGIMGRIAFFLRQDDSEEAREFNRQLKAAFRSNSNEDKTRLIYQELERCREEAGIRTQMDIVKIFDLTDEELVDRFDSLYRYGSLMVEFESLGKDGVKFTEEQEREMKLLHHLMNDLHQYQQSRLSIIANPHYEEIDPRMFYDLPLLDGVVSMSDRIGSYRRAMGDREPKGKDNAQPIYTYFDQIYSANNSRGNSGVNRAVCLEPELKNAVLSASMPAEDPLFDLATYLPVVARTETGRDLVLTNSIPLRIQTSEEYMTGLSELADQADKRLLTGSRQFADMQKALKELNSQWAANRGDTDTLAGKTAELIDAAKAYLDYKGIEPPYRAGNLRHMGKNQREQSRLEVAGKILHFAEAQSDALQRLAAKNLQAPQEQPKQQEQQVQQEAPKAAEVNRIENFGRTMTEKMSLKMRDVKSEGFAPTKEEFAVLATLACGSDKAYYLRGINPENSVRVMNENPGETYSAVMQQALFENKAGTDKSWSKVSHMMSGAQSMVRRAIEKGDFALLGQVLADGLKENNRLLQGEKTLSDQFCAYAQFGARALELMQRVPALAQAAQAHLSEADIQAVKAAKAISDLHQKGMESRKALEERFAAGQQSEMDVQDMANVCQMYAVGRQFAAGQIDLAQSPYGAVEGLADQINNTLTGSGQLNSFLSRPAGEKAAALKDPEQMSALYLSGIAPKQSRPMAESIPNATFEMGGNAPVVPGGFGNG